MDFKYNDQNLKIHFDVSESCSSLISPDNKNKVFKLSAIAKVYFIKKVQDGSYSVIYDSMALKGTDSDIELGLDIYKKYNYNHTYGFNFEEICDYQNICLKSKLYICNETVKIRRSIFKKEKNLDKPAKLAFEKLCNEKFPLKYNINDLRTISGILNNIIYINKKHNKIFAVNKVKIEEEFITKEFDNIYESMIEFNKNKNKNNKE